MATDFDSDPQFDRVLRERAAEAAARWDGRKKLRDKRTKAVKDNRPLDADSPARLALRINRLVNDVRLSSRNRRLPDNPTLRSLIERTTPVGAEDVNAELLQEVVLGARNFLSIEFLERGLQSAKSVGRILIQAGGSVRARGTGFLVAPGLVLTNEHVLTSKGQAASCSIEMDYEQNRFGPAVQSQVFKFEPKRLFINDRDVDFALVAVAGRSDRGAKIEDYRWLALNAMQGKISITENDYLNVIQHPLGREKEVVVRDNRLLDLVIANDEAGHLGPFLHYESDTEKGSSGSPVLNDQWEVVALHHAGVPARNAAGKWLDKDGKIWNEKTQPVADISWIANEGARVSAVVATLAKAQVNADVKRLLEPLLSSQPPVAEDEVRRSENVEPEPVRNIVPDQPTVIRPPKPDEVVPSSPRQGSSVDFDVPLRISVSLGDAKGSRASTPAIVSSPRARDELLIERLSAEDYADREGYDPKFLGVSVPFPTMKRQPRFGNVLRVPRPARPKDHFELRYHRFSVIMNEKRRLAYVSACNVNFDPPETAARDEGSQSWRLEPRLDKVQQLGAAYYDDNPYDKGHLTRRDDAAWGSDKDDALAANWDTFHYTNAGPQHELFNRSDDFTGANLDLWGDLENHISEQGGDQRIRLSVFSGPIFTTNDRPFKDALVPLAYFKLVIWKDRRKSPGAIGLILEQDDLIRDVPKEAIEAGRFSIRQKRISVIESKLDISFGVVTGWDQTPPTKPSTNKATESLDDDGILLTSVNDIVLGGPAPKRSRR